MQSRTHHPFAPLLTWVGAFALAACGGTQPASTDANGAQPIDMESRPPEAKSPKVAMGDAPPSAAAPSAPTAPPTTAAPGNAGSPAAAEARRFPPLGATAPFPETAAEGDGIWRPIGDAALSESAAQAPAVAVQTVLHPHKQKRYVSMNVVAIDLSVLKLSWIVGNKDLKAELLKDHQTPGLIPVRDQESVVLAFNGGFQARHGWWGMMSDGVTLVDPKPHGCTLAIFGDESVKIAPYSELESERPRMQSFRQTPPCLVHNGEIHPNLLKGNLKSWAGQVADLKTRRRSAVGISADGKTLFYAVGSETEASDLARGLHALGASDGMQLDINWAWARLLLVGRIEGQPRFTSSLMPEALYGKSECFTRPSDRDFFYLSR